MMKVFMHNIVFRWFVLVYGHNYYSKYIGFNTPLLLALLFDVHGEKVWR